MNKNYDHSVKETSLSPPGGFRTQVSALASTCHLQQGRTNPEFSIVLRKAYPSGGKKRLQGYARLSGLWVIAFAGSITKHASLYSISLAVIISSLTNHSIKHMYYFQAGGKQSELFYHLSYSSPYYGARSQPSSTVSHGDSRTNVSQLGTLKHTPRLYPRHKQDQPIPLFS